MMRVVATAGHIDHGKSALVEALTGVNPDRLKEEQERGMTIDLGFGYLALPDGTRVGIVDVPGHRDFIDNMLAGVGGVDAALLVVAADEGPMPQTREHLAILDLLGVSSGVVALTKIDKAGDAEWLALVRKDLTELLQPTALAGAEIVSVSARTGAGLPELRQALMRALARCPVRPDLGRPRLPVDRVFSLAGFGVVATGTLIDGPLAVGDEVEILPGGKRARIRGIQIHKEKAEQAEPGSRAALNLSGIELGEVKRGLVIARPGSILPARRIDLRVRVLADSGAPLRHDDRVKFYLGAAETMARVRILGMESIPPGGEGWAQCVLASEVAAARGDRVILRRPSPGATIGGGEIVDPAPGKLHKRFDPGVIGKLEALRKGGADGILQTLNGMDAAFLKEALQAAGGEAGVSAVPALIERGEVILLAGDPAAPATALVCSRTSWQSLVRRMTAQLERYHREFPLRGGMPREEFRARLNLAPKAVGPVLARAAAERALVETPRGVRLPGHTVRFSPAQEESVRDLLARFERDPFNPPSVKECLAELGEDVYSVLVENDTLKPVSEEVVFLRKTFDEMSARIVEALRAREKLTVAETRDLFGSSRKYILALLGYLDSQGITRREGDYRLLK
jgi:selenocysteine-specific elongation factor